MNISTRQQDIVAVIRRQGFMTVEALSGCFSVTPQTIRRDINELCAANLLRRRHGGAEYLDPPLINLSYESRRITRVEAKRAIGAHVARLIPDHASVSFGIGTTPEFVARALTDHEDLTVVTNNLNIAMLLSASRPNRIVVPGGTVRFPDRDLLGPDVVDMFHDYRVDFGIFGIGGIDPDGTLVDFDRAEVLARTALRESCRTAILVADISKCARLAPARGGHLGEADIIVLDETPPDAFLPLFRQAGIAERLHLAQGDLS
ncbi:MAG: DeoR/GlpR family DNA-binding transcription regulator [Rhodospirillaceae bacterium]|nr:DeoR/GlpR family DNA-binding transcription regulator [Rhodospirillaceae bacterium]